METTDEFKNRITQGIQELEATLSGSDQQVEEVLTTLLEENDHAFRQMGDAVAAGDWKKLRAEIHRAKPRYGYVGLDDITLELTEWETSLLHVTKADFHQERLHYFTALNERIAAEVTSYTSAHNTMLETAKPTRKKILVAEDDEVNSMVFQLFIEGMGYDVILAKNGEEAVTVTRIEKPDLIFMDVHMPYYSGLEAIRELRSSGLQTPIISLSASTRLQEEDQSRAHGADDFMVKPAGKESIRKIIEKYLVK